MALFANWNLLFGVLSWLVPFLAAFAFFDQTGTLTIAQPLFKSLMVVIGGAVGVGLLVLAFRQTTASITSGLAIGLLWLAINLILDFLVLVPMSDTTTADYLSDIGLRYLLFPIIAVGMGAAAERRP
jgi:hypothetical protein